MNTSTLRVGTFGDEVRDLHWQLRQLGFELPSAEVERVFFGPATAEAVRKFQRGHQLPVTGEVDSNTKAALASAPGSGQVRAAVPRPPSVADSTSLRARSELILASTTQIAGEAAHIKKGLSPKSQDAPNATPNDPALQVALRIDEADLEAELRQRLTGIPADGSMQSLTRAQRVVWVDSGDEVLVHLDTLQVRLLERAIVISMDLESDQTGRGPVIVRFAFGGPQDEAGLIATSDEVPHGNPLLLGRWGSVLQSAVWAALLELAQECTPGRGHAPYAIHALPGQLEFISQGPQSTIEGSESNGRDT